MGSMKQFPEWNQYYDFTKQNMSSWSLSKYSF